MKIGVITFWQGNDNYGMMMQCWALQHVLKEMGHEPYVVRFSPQSQKNIARTILKVITIYPILKFILKRRKNKEKENIYRELALKNELRKFRDFRKEHLAMSELIYHSWKELKQTPPTADCYIVGSDQVWAQLLNNENNRGYFLDFGLSTVKKIAYAPSFSMKSYPSHLIPKLKTMLSKLDHISVREYDGVKICAEAGFKADKVLDPTLLLNELDYTKLCHNLKEEKNIFIYSLNISSSEDIRWNELKAYQDKLKLQTIVTPASGYIPGIELFGNDVEYSYAPIERWLEHIYNAHLVVTSSFHGIVFCILFKKDFVYVPLKGKWSQGNNRIYDLLNELNLNDRMLHDNNSYESISSTNIHWQDVHSKLDKIKQDSIEYLKQTLK